MVLYRFLADAIVVLHAAYVGFVVIGFLGIILGIILRWSWIRGFWFRACHFLMILVVVFESVWGIRCPLTTWEENLREAAGEEVTEGTFLGRAAHDLLFYDISSSTFAAIYCAFGAMVLLTLVLAPPRLPRESFQRWNHRLFRRRGERDSHPPDANGTP